MKPRKLWVPILYTKWSVKKHAVVEEGWRTLQIKFINLTAKEIFPLKWLGF